MNERIQKALDGEIARAELTREELVALAEYEATIAAARTTVPDHPIPDLTDAVMARVRELPAHGRAEAGAAPSAHDRPGNPVLRALDWLWTPRPVALRPAWGLAAAVLAVALFGALPRLGDVTRGGVTAPVAASSAEIYVYFRLDAPEASSVHLAGDFTAWEPAYELHESQPGVWTVVVPLEAGVHDYAFVIDGEIWTPDPLATRVDDGFGGENSRLSLLPPERIRA